MAKLFLFLIITVLSLPSCKGQTKEIEITKKPVFSELDTFVTSTGKININKNDYFLVKGEVGDKELLKKRIQSFINNDTTGNCKNFTNYMMFFYRESNAVNEKKIQQTDSEYKYKIFIYTKDDDYIASYSCWNGFSSSNILFQPRYK